MKGTVYSETVVHAAPREFVKDAPYQLAIVTLEDGTRITGRVEGGRVHIGDPVTLVANRNGVDYFSLTTES